MSDNKNILVTGGAGYIGSHVCKALSQKGYTPITYDNFSSGNHEAVQWGPKEEGDIRDESTLNTAIKKHNPQAIMHFAALIQVGDSVTNPSEYYNNNVFGSYTLLEAARKHNIQNMVFSSTAAVYGMPNVKIIPEDSPLSPINPYGHTKLAMENMIRNYSDAYSINHAILRYFNAAGADLETQTGTAYPKDTHLIPLIMQAASGERDDIKILGTDYETPDGTAIRDYIHVWDLAIAHVKALEHIMENKENITLNLGTSNGYSVREVIETTQKNIPNTIKVMEEGRRPGDPAILVADATKAQKTLNWTPKHSDLETIVKTAWLWKEKQLKNRKAA